MWNKVKAVFTVQNLMVGSQLYSRMMAMMGFSSINPPPIDIGDYQPTAPAAPTHTDVWFASGYLHTQSHRLIEKR